jgi:hypothetical protein
MSGLERAIAVLDVLGSVVQAVPVVGDGLKSAIEIATKICETVKVRMCSCLLYIGLNFMQEMKENREAYEQLVDRAVQLLAAVANTISKASPERLKGMESNVERLLR